METTEKIVESYCRYVMKWFTIPNIKCKGQFEIDLLAIDTTRKGQKLGRYHIECGVSISGSFSKLTTKKFDPDLLKQRNEAAGQRRTLGYFIKRKFEVKQVHDELDRYGFKPGNYKRVIVTWSSTEEARKEAANKGIVIWELPKLLNEIAEAHLHNRAYFTDDTARTIQLYAMAMKAKESR